MAKDIENEYLLVKQKLGKDFSFAGFVVDDWNNDPSPWPASPVFGKDGFGNGASVTLNEIVKYCGDSSKSYYLCGYSLGGLFALWASCQTSLFKGIAAVSPSVWFPGFTEYLKSNKALCKSVYLSLGEKEPKTKNALMQTVGEKVLECQTILNNEGIDAFFEWNQGNHFQDATLRAAKGIAHLLAKRD